MTADELVRLAGEPHFIEGIHNYCDRWCERCAVTDRCFQFAQLRAMEDEAGFDPTAPDHEEKQMLQMLQSSFELAGELIERGAAQHNIDIHSPEFQASLENDEDDEEDFDAVGSHPLMLAAQDYAFAVEAWFARAGERLEQRIRQAQQSDEINAQQLQPEDIRSALEVICWDQFRLASTLTGVLATLHAGELLAEHHNGKIKSILIGIDRSLLAWGKVQLFWPAAAKAIMHLIGRLSELRLWLERLFPEARDFIRPGFDEASTQLI